MSVPTEQLTMDTMKKSRQRSRSRDKGGERRSSSSTDRHKKQHKSKKHSRDRRSSTPPSPRPQSRSPRRHRSRSTTRSSGSRSGSPEPYRRGRRSHRTTSRNRSSSSDKSGSSHYRRTYRTHHDSYKFQEPNRTVMIRELARHLSANDIRHEVFKCGRGVAVRDIRLIPHRDTGESRGFAFLEFHSVKDAVHFMELTKGTLVLQDVYHANMVYSSSMKTMVSDNLDWSCEQCNGMNFRRRDSCYKCNAERPKESLGNCAEDEISHYPTSTIILSDLDILTTEGNILEAFQLRADIASIPIKSLKVRRETDTNISRGHCRMELATLLAARTLFEAVQEHQLEIDGRIAYGKSTNLEERQRKNFVVAGNALAAAHWTMNQNSLSPQPTCINSHMNIDQKAEYSASLYAKSHEEYKTYLVYYKKYYMDEQLQQIANRSATPSSKAAATTGSPAKNLPKDTDNFVEKDGGSETDKLSVQPLARVNEVKAAKAKLISTKMEKWAKTINMKSSSMKKQLSTPATTTTSRSTESNFVDEEKLVCLLCKRKFETKGILHKHVAMSTLHQANVEALNQSSISSLN